MKRIEIPTRTKNAILFSPHIAIHDLHYGSSSHEILHAKLTIMALCEEIDELKEKLKEAKQCNLSCMEKSRSYNPAME